MLRGWTSGMSLLITLVLACPPAARGQDDRYESDNTAQTVRSPVLDKLPKFEGPPRVAMKQLEGQAGVAARELPRIAALEGQDVLVLGKVESVFVLPAGNKLILNFGRDIRHCFKAVIDIRDYPKWGTVDAKRIARYYEGTNLAADGLVVQFQGNPQMLVSMPYQLRIVTGR